MSKATTTPTVADRGRTVWHMRLQSAFRTAVACTVVGCSTLYGPEVVKRNVTFPAFSYVTAILIVCDGNLGDTIRGCCHAFYATIQVVPFGMLSIQLIGLSRFYPYVAALVVAVTSFVVALPESTPLMSKRIAFGQLVIVYVAAVNHRDDSDSDSDSFNFNVSWLPLHVAASTALGAISALLAMLLPYPRLAYLEVRKLCRLYAESAAERMNLYLQALTTQGRPSTPEFIAKTKLLAQVDKKIVRSITLIQDGIMWERPWMRLSRHEFVSPGQRLQALETPMRGMEIALEGNPPLTAGSVSEDIDNLLLGISTLLDVKAEQPRCFLPFNSTTAPELKTDSTGKINLPYETILSMYHDLSASFFLSCAQQFMDDINARKNQTINQDVNKRKQLKHQEQLASSGSKGFWSSWIFKLGKERWIFALKCSLSLGLAVLIGLLFNKENGYWSGLTIAISFVEGRQAVLTEANARAQGTAIGSVYGILGCFLFKTMPKIRFLALFPWILFTNFLMHSRMYTQAGGTSAVIGALLILGRNDYGLPDEFAIARLTEAIIGLLCFILVELLFRPTSVSTLVKKQLHQSLLTIQGCIQQLVRSSMVENQPSINVQAFKDNIEGLNSEIQDLQNFIQEAEIEPTFSFLPFPGSKYKKLHHSLSNMADVLSCMSYSLEYMLQVSQDHIAPWNKIHEHMQKDLEVCNDNLGSSLKCLEIVSQEPQEKTYHDEEKGDFLKEILSSTWNKDVEQRINSESSLLQRSKEIGDSLNDIEDEDELKGKMLVSLSALCFCTSYLINESKAIMRGTRELIHWEYLSSQQ